GRGPRGDAGQSLTGRAPAGGHPLRRTVLGVGGSATRSPPVVACRTWAAGRYSAPGPYPWSVTQWFSWRMRVFGLASMLQDHPWKGVMTMSRFSVSTRSIGLWLLLVLSTVLTPVVPALASQPLSASAATAPVWEFVISTAPGLPQDVWVTGRGNNQDG